MLSSLGILEGYEDGTFKPEGTITRAEFAAVTVRLLGAEDSAQGAIGGGQFSDVPDDQWFAGYVNYAASLGIINGMGRRGTFAPQEPVKYQEAVKMLVCMLG